MTMDIVKNWAKEQYFFNYIHKKTNLDHLVILGIFCGLAVLGIFSSTVNSILVAAIALIRPAYDTFRIIESPSADNNILMLRYWVVIGFLSFLNRYLGRLIEGLIIAGIIKLIIVYGLVAKRYVLSQKLYKYTIGPFLRFFDTHIGSKIDILGKARKIIKEVKYKEVTKDTKEPSKGHVEEEPIIEESKERKPVTETE